MARSRNIKPGFFLNDELAEVEPLGRLLFAGLWCIADREGRLKDRPKRIKAEVLPYDDCDTDNLLNQLAKHGFITRYTVDGDAYIQIVNFAKHQNPHRNERDSEIPAQEHSDTSTIQAPEHSNTNRADSLLLIPDSLNRIEDCPNPDKDHPSPPENITPDERDILNTLKGIKEYPLDYEIDLDHIRQLSIDFPTIDVRAEIKRFAAYKLDKPLTKKSNARLQIRNWMANAKKFQEERGWPKSGKPKPDRHSNNRQGEDYEFIYE